VSAFTPAWPAKAVEDRVQGRIERQKLLSSASPPRFTAILDESVLHRIVGGPSVMAGQLRRLLEISEQPSVSIRIVPYDAGTVPAGVNKFIILALPDRTEAVFTEEVTRMRRIDQAEEVKSYKTTWMALADLAASPTFTRDRIRAQLLTYESAQRTA
jgi:hypothetical protein